MRNELIIKAIEDSGGVPGPMWCEVNGLRYTRANELINGTKSPLREDTGEWRLSALKLCEAVGKQPDELWPELRENYLEQNFTSLGITKYELEHLMPTQDSNSFLDYVERQLCEQIDEVLSTLNNQQQQVIRYRFGVGKDREYLLEEVSNLPEFKVSIERIRQIEAKALHLMRQPKRSELLRCFLDYDPY